MTRIKQFWIRLGQVAFWAAWPLLLIYMRLGERTRMLIVAEGKVLVVRGWLGNGKWVLPGGGLHKGEDPMAGVLRELYEETGVKLDSSTVESGGIVMATDSGLTFRYHRFFAELPGVTFLQEQALEIITAQWVPLAEITTANAQKSTLDMIAASKNGRPTQV